MINVILSGRLGNLLFQYATAKHLAIKNNTSVHIDIESYLKFKNNNPEQILRQLSYLNFDKSVFKLNILERFTSFIGLKKLKSNDIQHYKEKHWGFDPEILALKNGVTLKGYFQSEKYFKDIEPVIREEFRFRHVYDENDADYVYQQIRDKNSVGIHVRRGDYIGSRIHFDLSDSDYYSNSIKYMKENLSNPIFFIFSDDIEWCRNNLSSPEFFFVDLESSKENPIIDMSLMSVCRHNIISNSTFSWWAAWLNNNIEKVVLAPNKWFKTKANILVLEDTIPEEWIVINA